MKFLTYWKDFDSAINIKRPKLRSVRVYSGISVKKMKKAQNKVSCFCLDSQSHLCSPELIAFMKGRKSPPYAYEKAGNTYVVVGQWHRRLRKNHTSPRAKVAAMDGAGIELTALSINDPGPERFGKDGLKIAEMANNFIAEVVLTYPKRFFGLAFLPLQDMKAAELELERCVERLRMRGIFLYSNLNGEFPDLPKYRALFKWAEELDLPIVMHPAYPACFEDTKDYELTAGLGLMFDTSISLARIILAGILEEHPRLRLLCPHLGGTLGYLIGRLDHQSRVLGRGTENIKKLPGEYLNQIYFDTVSPNPLAIKYCYDLLGADRLLYGSDHPWVEPELIADCIKELHLPSEDERKIFGENAKALFKL